MSVANVIENLPEPASPSPDDPRDAVETPSHFYIPSLDGMRAVAIVIVFLSHAGLSEIVPGLLGVTIFFFLSGYLITTLLRMELEKTGRIAFGQFYLRRTLRIFPPLYALLVVISILGLAGVLGTIRWGAVAAEALQVSNFYLIKNGASNMPPGTDVLWSLAIEEHFYLLFPLLFVLLRKAVPSARGQVIIMLGGCAALLAWRFAMVSSMPTDHYRTLRIAHGTDTRIDSMLFGCAMAVWGNPAKDKPIWSELNLKYVLFPLGVALMLFTLRGSDFFRDTLRFTLQGIALWPIFTAAILYPRWPVFVPLNWRPVKFIGAISYTLYLVHHVILSLFEMHLRAPHWLLAILTAITSVIVATISYYGLERPCARLRKKLSRVGA